jgi:ATP-dependent helicase/nuclease subunit B
LDKNLVEEFLLVVPTNRQLRHIKKELISNSPQKSLNNINLETLSTLAVKMITASGNIVNLVSESMSSVLVKQSFNNSELTYFNNYKNDIPKGSLDRIKAVISEYKKNNISPEILLKEANNLSGSEKWKTVDLANVYREYQEKLEQFNLMEIGDIYQQLTALPDRKFAENFKMIYPFVNQVFIEGFSEFTHPEIQILLSLASMQKLDVYIEFDYNEANPNLFGHLTECLNKFKRSLFSYHPLNDSGKDDFANNIKSNLFKEKTIIDPKPENIWLLKGNDFEDEITLIAKQIKKLILEENIEPHKICVAFNLISKYSPIIRDKFSNYGIPFNLTDRYNLNMFPPVISIINILEIQENDFYYRNIFRSLSSKFIEIENVHLNDLMRAASELKIVSGYKNWIDSINLSLSYEANDEEYGNDSLNKHSLENILIGLKSIKDLLNPFSKHLTIREFEENFNNLIFTLNIPQNLIKYSKGAEEENIKAFTTFFETSQELFDLLELEYGKLTKFPLKFFLNQLRTVISAARFNIKEKSNYGVLITTLNEIRGLKFDCLFIAGMFDGDLPTRYTPEIFIASSFAKNENKHLLEERYLFYQALCSWSNRLYLTYPLSDGRKELVESNFISSLREICIINEIAKSSFQNDVFSRQELLIHACDLEDKIDLARMNIDIKEIKREIEIDISRRENDLENNNPFTGMIGEDVSLEAKIKLANYLKRKYSISQLESYASCPFKYYTERILKLKALAEPSEEFEALEMGSLLHAILYEFYNELTKNGKSLTNCNDIEFRYYEKLMFTIAEEKVASVNISFPLAFFEKEKILGIDGDKKNSLLYKFLEYERFKSTQFVPKYFESVFDQYSFSSLNGKESLLNDSEEFFIKGKIDRIDIDEESKVFKVVDYKLSGKKPSLDDLSNGISLQLPLYLFAAKSLLKENTGIDFIPAAAEIFSLKPGDEEFGSKEVKMSSTRKNYEEASDEQKKKIIETNEAIIAGSLKKIEKYIISISQGKFNLSALMDREEKICKYCDFNSICRVNEFN